MLPELFHSPVGSATQGQPCPCLASSSPGSCTRNGNFPPFHWVLCLFQAACTVPADGISSISSHLISAIQLTWEEQVWPILSRFFDFFPTEQGPTSCALGLPGRICSPAGLDGFPTHIPSLCEVRMSPGFGKANWDPLVWSLPGSIQD